MPTGKKHAKYGVYILEKSNNQVTDSAWNVCHHYRVTRVFMGRCTVLVFLASLIQFCNMTDVAKKIGNMIFAAKVSSVTIHMLQKDEDKKNSATRSMLQKFSTTWPLLQKCLPWEYLYCKKTKKKNSTTWPMFQEFSATLTFVAKNSSATVSMLQKHEESFSATWPMLQKFSVTWPFLQWVLRHDLWCKCFRNITSVAKVKNVSQPRDDIGSDGSRPDWSFKKISR